MDLPFVKMEGCGNDFVFLNALGDAPAGLDPGSLPELARAVSDRRRGIGSDGLIVVSPGRGAPVAMRMWNADGSEARLCVNGLRCAAALAAMTVPALGSAFPMETASGPREVRVLARTGRAWQVEIAAGEPDFRRTALPALGEGDRLWGESFDLEGGPFPGYGVSMGNPHLVLLAPDEAFLAGARIEALEPLSRSPGFPDGVNVHLVAADPARVSLRTWERGSGPTLACGSGALASYAVARELGRVSGEVETTMPGGSVWIRPGPGGLVLRGPAREVYRGTWPGRARLPGQ